MVMTDVSGSKDRAGALGRLGVAYGVGIVVGPPVGGESSSLALSISHLSPFPSLPASRLRYNSVQRAVCSRNSCRSVRGLHWDSTAVRA